MTNTFLFYTLVSQTPESLNPIDLMLQADWVVKIVMLLLIVASIVCWTIILAKWTGLRTALKQNQSFSEDFWASGSLEAAQRVSEAHPNSNLTRIFKMGLHEFNQISQLNLSRDETLELLETNVTRSLDKAIKIESESLNTNVSFLANTASAAPFIGLFGTVWGIMNSFINIGQTGASNLAVVAPGIAEALIATAMGLFAAIPAVLFYNYFVHKTKRITIMMKHFSVDFLNTAKRSI